MVRAWVSADGRAPAPGCRSGRRARRPAMRECWGWWIVVVFWGRNRESRGGDPVRLLFEWGFTMSVSSQLFPDLNERIGDFERRMAELQAEIDRLPEGRERRDALDAIAEVARALAALKDRKT